MIGGRGGAGRGGAVLALCCTAPLPSGATPSPLSPQSSLPHTSAPRTRTPPHHTPTHRPDDYEKAKGKYIVTADTLRQMKRDAIVMHPLPRVDEVRRCRPRGRCADSGCYKKLADWLLLVFLVRK